MRAAVLGAGSWGTTFAQVLCDAGTSTVVYSRKPALAKAIAVQHENPEYLPGISLTPVLDACSDVREALDGADLVAFAVPAQTLRAATADIMADITALLATIRQQTPPAVPWDLDAGGRVPLERTKIRPAPLPDASPGGSEPVSGGA